MAKRVIQVDGVKFTYVSTDGDGNELYRSDAGMYYLKQKDNSEVDEPPKTPNSSWQDYLPAGNDFSGFAAGYSAVGSKNIVTNKNAALGAPFAPVGTGSGSRPTRSFAGTRNVAAPVSLASLATGRSASNPPMGYIADGGSPGEPVTPGGGEPNNSPGGDNSGGQPPGSRVYKGDAVPENTVHEYVYDEDGNLIRDFYRSRLPDEDPNTVAEERRPPKKTSSGSSGSAKEKGNYADDSDTKDVPGTGTGKKDGKDKKDQDNSGKVHIMVYDENGKLIKDYYRNRSIFEKNDLYLIVIHKRKKHGNTASDAPVNSTDIATSNPWRSKSDPREHGPNPPDDVYYPEPQAPAPQQQDEIDRLFKEFRHKLDLWRDPVTNKISWHPKRVEEIMLWLTEKTQIERMSNTMTITGNLDPSDTSMSNFTTDGRFAQQSYMSVFDAQMEWAYVDKERFKALIIGTGHEWTHAWARAHGLFGKKYEHERETMGYAFTLFPNDFISWTQTDDFLRAYKFPFPNNITFHYPEFSDSVKRFYIRKFHENFDVLEDDKKAIYQWVVEKIRKEKEEEDRLKKFLEEQEKERQKIANKNAKRKMRNIVKARKTIKKKTSSKPKRLKRKKPNTGWDPKIYMYRD